MKTSVQLLEKLKPAFTHMGEPDFFTAEDAEDYAEEPQRAEPLLRFLCETFSVFCGENM